LIRRRSAFAVVAVTGASLFAGIYCAAAQNAAIQDKAENIAVAFTPLPDVSGADIALVRKAIDSLRRSAENATQIETAISDPAARKLVEWIILRSGNGFPSTRYLAFIAANPSWPSVSFFRRCAEEMLWVEHHKPSEVFRFFKGSEPQTAWGRLALARALSAQGDTEGAHAQVRNAWHNDGMSAELEQQVLKAHAELLTRADHKVRMGRRLGAGDKEAAMRAAHHFWTDRVAIARARRALARVHVLRHQDKILEAAKALLSASFDTDGILDPEEWWVERRILSRELLDIGDVHSAYRVVRDAVEPVKENSGVERLFMAGWIALQFLQDPAAAAEHFAHIQDVTIHPTSLARSHYWLGRTAEALHQPANARTEYEAAARSPAAYYGQLARARLGLGARSLAAPPSMPDTGGERPELVRALDILYALNEHSLVISFMAALGDELDDMGSSRRWVILRSSARTRAGCYISARLP
jgi:soluble lytic murein transglycosylase